MQPRAIIKYIFDRFFALVAIILLFPVLLIISVAIITGTGSPVFFRQIRAGRKGKPFTILKFRTMNASEYKNTVSIANDPRNTRVGAALRKWKLDELPELFNVLVGDMSFVGPRPDMTSYAESLKGEDRKILSLRPGITGPATLKYINEEEILAGVTNPVEYNDQVIYPDKVRINLKYLEQYSLTEDLRIIYHTLIRKKIDEY